jgi:hypothetical protein
VYEHSGCPLGKGLIDIGMAIALCALEGYKQAARTDIATIDIHAMQACLCVGNTLHRMCDITKLP